MVFQFSFPDPLYIYNSGPGGRAEAKVTQGIQLLARLFRDSFGVNLRARRVQSGGILIRSGVPQYRGVQYRGQWTGSMILLHSGQYAPGKYKDPFPSALSVGQIVWHEYLHSLGFGHSSDPSDIMHPNAPASVTDSKSRLISLFGRSPIKQVRSKESVVVVDKIFRNCR